MKSIGIAILVVLAVIVLAVGGWFGYWALAKANTNQQYQVNTNSQQYQQSLVDQERNRVQGYDQTTDPAQKQQIATTFCQVYPDLNPAPTDLVQASARICQQQ